MGERGAYALAYGWVAGWVADGCVGGCWLGWVSCVRAIGCVCARVYFVRGVLGRGSD